MDEEKCWMHFIKCGRVEDYLKFTNARRMREINEGGCHAVYDRGIGYKGVEHRGERPFSNSPYA